jgi:ABC-type multidrug transport system fused ATPase/permease subunit
MVGPARRPRAAARLFLHRHRRAGGAIQHRDSLAVPLAVVGVVFIGMQVLGPLHTALSENLGLGYTGAVVIVAAGPHASPASAILVLTAGARLSSYLSGTVSEIGFLRGTWMDGARRLAWLEDYAGAMARDADLPAPDGIGEGIRFEHVTFCYPGSEHKALDDIDLFLPPGR